MKNMISVPTSTNTAYEITTSVSTDLLTTASQAYRLNIRVGVKDELHSMPASTDEEHDIHTSTNAAYEITTSSSAYAATDISTSTRHMRQFNISVGVILTYVVILCQPPLDRVKEILTFTYEAFTSTNSTYIATDVPTPTNQAYERLYTQQSGIDEYYKS